MEKKVCRSYIRSTDRSGVSCNCFALQTGKVSLHIKSYGQPMTHTLTLRTAHQLDDGSECWLSPLTHQSAAATPLQLAATTQFSLLTIDPQ